MICRGSLQLVLYIAGVTGWDDPGVVTGEAAHPGVVVMRASWSNRLNFVQRLGKIVNYMRIKHILERFGQHLHDPDTPV